MTSSNGNIFRVTGHLCGEFTGLRWIPRKGQWRGALMFSLICAWINLWVNNRKAGDLRRYRAHYDVIVMIAFVHDILVYHMFFHLVFDMRNSEPWAGLTYWITRRKLLSVWWRIRFSYPIVLKLAESTAVILQCAMQNFKIIGLMRHKLWRNDISRDFWFKMGFGRSPLLKVHCIKPSWRLTVYPKKYAHGFCFAVLCYGYTLTDFPISISASKATLMDVDKYFMWIHYERLHNHNKAKHNKTVCIFLGIYCIVICLRPDPFGVTMPAKVLAGIY